MIKAFAFDLEGTMVNLEGVHIQNWIDVCANHGQTTTLEGMIDRMPEFIGAGDAAVAGVFSAWLNVSPDALLAQKDSLYAKSLQKVPIQPRPGLMTFLLAAKSKDIPLAIGSLTRDRYAMEIITTSGLSALFPENTIVLESHVEHVKPAPDVYLETARRLGVKPEEQLVFEDSARGVKAAIAAGSAVIAMPVYFDLTEQALREAGAQAIYKSWDRVNLATLLNY